MDFTSSFSTLTFLSTTFCRQNCALFPACTCLRSHQCCIWLYMIKNIKLHLLSCKPSLFSLTTWCWSHAHSAAGFHHCWHSGSRLSGVRMLDDGKSGGITEGEGSSWSLSRDGERGEEKECPASDESVWEGLLWSSRVNAKHVARCKCVSTL